MLLSVSAVNAEDSTSLNLNDTNVAMENPVSYHIDMSNEQEIIENSNDDVSYTSDESFENDIDLNNVNISIEKEITNKPIFKAPNTVDNIYVDPTNGDDNNNGINWDNSVKTISKALDLVNVNGNIYLANGEHTNSANITKNITLIGQNREKTILTKSKNSSFLLITNLATVKIYNCSFINNNESENGSAIYIDSGNLIIYDCSFINNTSPNMSDKITPGYFRGAAICAYKANITVNNCSFINNAAKWGGVAIYVEKGNLDVNNSVFINNTAGTSAAVEVFIGNLTVNNSVFVNNSGVDFGGAIHIFMGNITVDNSVFIANTVNNGSAIGGAICVECGNVSVSNSIFINNSEEKDDVYDSGGGAIGIYGNSGFVIINNCSFINNTATNNGGAIEVSGNDGFVIIINNCLFINNTANSGSAIEVLCSSNITLSNSNFTNNNATEHFGSIHVLEGNLTANNCSFMNNNGKTGSAVVVENGNITIGGSIFINNYGTDYSGVVAVNVGNIYVDNCTFINNTGRDGVVNTNYGNLTVINSAFTHNELPIWVMEGNLVVINSNFTNNFDGAISVSKGNLTADNCIFINNAAYDGGAISVMYGNLTVDNSVFVNNTANGYGGVIYGEGSNIAVTNCVLSNNTSNDGSVIFTYFQMNIIVENNWWGSSSPDWKSVVSINGTGYTPKSYVVLDVAVSEVGFNVYEITAKLHLNGTQTIADIPTRDIEFKCGSEIIRGKMINGVFNKIYSLDMGDKKDISITVDNETQNITLIGHKLTTDMTVIINDIVYGENGTVVVILSSDINDKLSIYIDGFSRKVDVINGVAKFQISGLNAGTHEISVVFDGNDKYAPVMSTCKLNVAKAAPALSIVIKDVNYDEIFNIDAVLTGVNGAKLSGDVIVTVNGKDYTVKVVDGKGTLKGIKLPAGSYVFSAKFAGNDNYNAEQISGNFKVNKIASAIDISVDDIKVGEDVTITVNVPSDATGDVVITVKGNDYTVAIVNGKAVQTIANLGVGTYDVTVKYAGDNNYNAISNNAKFTVSKVTPVMDVSADNIVFGEDLTINALLPADINGNVIITVDGKEYTVNVVNGKVTKPISGLTAGNHNIVVKYNGNDKYDSVEVSKTVNVAKANPTLDVVIADVDYNNVFTIEATLNGVNGAKLTGNVIVTINSKQYLVTVIDGKGTLEGINLPAGSYDFSARFAGNDNYNAVIDSDKFNVNKIDPILDVSINNTQIGENTTITVNLPSDAEGNVIITIDGQNYIGAITEGKVIIEVPNLKEGTYDVAINYNGDNNYNKANSTASFTISKINPVLDVNITDIIFGENLTVIGNLPADINGSAIISVDGVEKTVLVVNGKINEMITDLTAGYHIIGVKYNGNDKYTSIEVSKTVYVAKANPILNVIIDDVKVGEIINISATLTGVNNSPLNGKLIISLNNEDYVINVVNGKGNIRINAFNNNGVYNFTTTWSGDNNYMNTSMVGSFKVSKVEKYPANITIPGGVEGKNSTITIDLPDDATGEIIAIIDGKNYTGNVSNGTGSVDIPPLDKGIHNITVIYPGDDKYDSVIKEGNITVDVNKDAILVVDNVIMIYHDGSKLIAILKDYYGNSIANTIVTITINGVSYNRTTDKDGYAFLSLNLNSGIYNVTVTYQGNETYNGAEVNATVTINPTIISKDITKMYQNGTQFFANFTDSQGNPLINTTIQFNINGAVYERKTNEQGTARLNINLIPGKYTLTAYNPVTGEKKGFNITVKALITENSDIIKYYKNGTQYTAKVYNKDGTLAIGKNVTFNINGVFYNRTVNENGTVKLNINLNPGKYIITAIYDGYSVGNNVTVESTLITNDLSMNMQDGSKFNATVLNEQGKPLVNEIVTFNVNGVLYERISDENGVASLNINLISGEYIITSMWNDYQVGNKITIA
ncbi:S-layer family protein [uncultured Methanobrevibacter sp.]|uniref:beta strand repeat-containing protein n=1 Tax=uncultured Methanobrevibacter sp. TaxID=253161 RepID=UPI00260E5E50|nr:Ig-like domain repeat protein [uncultured Methanobrevibacter sp.]